jgi:hypothetical protein
MKGRITQIRQVVNDMETIVAYQIVIETEDLPNIKLGDCEVKQ